MVRLASALLALVCALVVVAPASADPIDDYRRNGSVDPCKYTDRQLQQGAKNLPPDVEQYAPGLADQLNQGRQGCGGGSNNRQPTRSEVVPGPASTSNGGGKGGGSAAAGGEAAAAKRRQAAEISAPPTPRVAVQRRLADITTPAVSARVGQGPPGWVTPLVLVLLAGALAAAFVRFRGVDLGGRLRPLRTSWADAGARSSDAFAELWDRVRLGR